MRKGDDMDMNWQAMLHEAANTSFEKDIEVVLPTIMTLVLL